MNKVKMTIEFCMMWNYAPKAASFAEQLFNHFRSTIEELTLIPSSGGAFEITVGEDKIYSKLDTGVFPDIDSIISIIESL